MIAARGGSKGFPGKNLHPLAGRPLIMYSISAARASRRLDDYLVSTDDPEIARVAREAGAPVPFLRPRALAGDDIPIWPAVSHAVDHWERAHGSTIDAAVLLQATSPLRVDEDIDGCIRRFEETAADLCASVVRAHDSPYFNLIEPVGRESWLMRPCSAAMRETVGRQTAPPVYALNGAVYVVRRTLLPELRNQFAVERYSAYEMPRHRSVDVDGPDDIALAEWLLTRSSSGAIAGA